jgi:putative PIN family toxin of toxin-antitoxin system
MKKIVIDTNLWISFLIGKRLQTMKMLFCHEDVSIYMCEELIDEILEVANRPKLAKYIKPQDIELLEKLIKTYCIFVEIKKKSSLPIRDPKDLYLLSLCESIPAEYILSGDEDLLSVDTQGKYQIMTFMDFFKLIFN